MHGKQQEELILEFRGVNSVMTENIWKLYMEMNMKVIFAVMNTNLAVVKIRPKKIQALTGF